MSEQKMFRKGEQRYLTNGIYNCLPVLYQILLWNTIDNLRDRGQELDYLQVFKIVTKEKPNGKGKLLEITHSQEKPKYCRKYTLPVGEDTEEINGKIFVIDDTDHATMMWAEEY